MATIITRLYASRDQAAGVVSALEADGFQADDITLVARDEGQDMGTFHAALANAGVHKAGAKTYAERTMTGQVVLVLRAPFGAGTAGMAIVDTVPAIDIGVDRTELHVPAQDTPVERLRYLPDLLPDGTRFMTTDGLLKTATPFSSLFRLPMTAKGGRAKLLDNPTPFSSMFKLPLLVKYRES